MFFEHLVLILSGSSLLKGKKKFLNKLLRKQKNISHHFAKNAFVCFVFVFSTIAKKFNCLRKKTLMVCDNFFGYCLWCVCCIDKTAICISPPSALCFDFKQPFDRQPKIEQTSFLSRHFWPNFFSIDKIPVVILKKAASNERIASTHSHYLTIYHNLVNHKLINLTVLVKLYLHSLIYTTW